MIRSAKSNEIAVIVTIIIFNVNEIHFLVFFYEIIKETK